MKSQKKCEATNSVTGYKLSLKLNIWNDVDKYQFFKVKPKSLKFPDLNKPYEYSLTSKLEWLGLITQTALLHGWPLSSNVLQQDRTSLIEQSL